jgi:hypothetical protein
MHSTQAIDAVFGTYILLISTVLAMESRPSKLLDQVRETIRLKHYSYRTEQSDEVNCRYTGEGFYHHHHLMRGQLS